MVQLVHTEKWQDFLKIKICLLFTGRSQTYPDTSAFRGRQTFTPSYICLYTVYTLTITEQF